MSLQTKLSSMAQIWIPKSSPRGWNEVTLAKCLKGTFKVAGLWPIVYDLGSIYVYDEGEGIWTELDRDTVKSLALKFSEATTEGGKRVQMTASRANGIYECLRLDDEVLNNGFFSKPREGIPFKNCLVVLENGEFKEVPHSPENRLRAKFRYVYKPGAKPTKLLKLLDEVFLPDKDKAQKIMALQEILGAAMAGVGTNYQRTMIATGEGSNGKNTVLDTLTGIFPAEFVTSIAPQKWGDQNYRAMLHNSLLNMVPDMQDTRILSNSDFKPIVSGDPVVAAHKHRDPFEFRCRASHIMICNDLPPVVDFSYGYRRRFLILGFNRQFSPDDEGTRTKQEIIDEVLSHDREAIGTWALEGYKRLVENGAYTEPPSHKLALDKWLASSDPVADFMSSICVRVVEGGDTDDHLYKEFKNWKKTSGHKKEWSMVMFRRRLDQLGVRVVDGKRLLTTGTEVDMEVEMEWLEEVQ